MKNFTLILGIVFWQLSSFAQIPTDSLLMYLPFNGNSIDESGNDNNGTVHGAILTEDRFGNSNSAYFFDGNNDYIEVLNNNINNTTEASISFWFSPGTNFNSATEYSIFMESDIDGDIDGDFILAFNRSNCGGAPSTDDGKIHFELQGDSENSNSINCPNHGLVKVSTIDDSWSETEWYYITAIINDGFITIYTDGVLQNSQPTTSSIFINNQPFYIGRYVNQQAYSRAFHGAIDDVRIYKKILNQHEISAIYNEGNETISVDENLNSDNLLSFNDIIKIYPNPAFDYLYIEVDDNNFGHKIKITNTLGQEVFRSTLSHTQYFLNLKNWSGSGMYIVQLYDTNENLIDVDKIIVQ